MLLFAAYLFFTHRASQHYYIPEGFSGWVTVKFEKQGTPPLAERDGVVEYHIPASGILETSSKLQTGWSRDEFFWEGASGKELIPKYLDCGAEKCRWIHDLKEQCMSYDKIIKSLPEMSDTLLWDNARISKTEDQAQVRSGRKTMLHFWVSPKPEQFFYKHDSLPTALKEW